LKNDIIIPDIKPLQDKLENAEGINSDVRANAAYTVKENNVDLTKQAVIVANNELRKVREQRTALLDNADMPLEGLSIEDGELIYNDQKWDCMSKSQQLKVATAIVRKLNPDCGFVLMDELERMDVDTLNEFGKWAKDQGLQIIATRVSTGDECSIVIEDGERKK